MITDHTLLAAALVGYSAGQKAAATSKGISAPAAMTQEKMAAAVRDYGSKLRSEKSTEAATEHSLVLSARQMASRMGPSKPAMLASRRQEK
jgi:hypothetical protein